MKNTPEGIGLLPLGLDEKEMSDSDISKDSQPGSAVYHGRPVPKPLGPFTAWLAKATPKQLADGEAELKELLPVHYQRAEKWRSVAEKSRLEVGCILYRYREIVKRQGSRDWTKWVVETVGLPRSTAYDWIDDWEKSAGLVPDGHDEAHPSVEIEGNPNPTAPDELHERNANLLSKLSERSAH